MKEYKRPDIHTVNIGDIEILTTSSPKSKISQDEEEGKGETTFDGEQDYGITQDTWNEAY